MVAALLAAIGVTSPLAAFAADDGVGRALLAARAALLLAAWWGASPRDSGARPPLRILAAAVLFVGSLAARALFLPFAAAALVVAWPRRGPRYGAALALALTVGVAALFSRPESPPSWSGNPAAETAAWIDRGNPFRAHFWAAQWATTESGQGDGHLALAKLDWGAGHRAEAEDLATKVAEQGEDEGVRGRAAEQLRAWGAPAVPPPTRGEPRPEGQ